MFIVISDSLLFTAYDADKVSMQPEYLLKIKLFIHFITHS